MLDDDIYFTETIVSPQSLWSYCQRRPENLHATWDVNSKTITCCSKDIPSSSKIGRIFSSSQIERLLTQSIRTPQKRATHPKTFIQPMSCVHLTTVLHRFGGRMVMGCLYGVSWIAVMNSLEWNPLPNPSQNDIYIWHDKTYWDLKFGIHSVQFQLFFCCCVFFEKLQMVKMESSMTLSDTSINIWVLEILGLHHQHGK